MTTGTERVTQAVTKTKKVWVVFMALLLVCFFLSQFPLWSIVYLVPIALVSYFASVTLTILAQSRDMEDNDYSPLLAQLQEDMRTGKIEPGSETMFERMRECGIIDVYPIGEVSTEIVGVYNGHKMYEWVEIQDPESKEFFKFYYHSPGQFEPDGSPILPEQDGIMFAHVEGIVYARDDE